MPSNLDKFKQDLDRLIGLGNELLLDLGKQALNTETKKEEPTLGNRFFSEYQAWYTEAQEVVEQVLPKRLDEFQKLYHQDLRRKTLDAITFSIQDWLLGVRAPEPQLWSEKKFNDIGAVFMRFQSQVGILKSAQGSFSSTLFHIRQLTQADVFDSEIDAARSLLSHGYGRAAGAMCGVVLEKHISQVCVDHKIIVTKKHPSIGDLNELLKSANIIDIPTWRFITRLGDIRNLCDHNKASEPTKEQITDLIDGVDKVTKTVA